MRSRQVRSGLVPILVLSAACAVLAQDSTTTTVYSYSSSSPASSQAASAAIISVSPIGSIITNPSVAVPTGSYQSLTGQVSAPTVLSSSATLTVTGNSSTSNSLFISGGPRSSTSTITPNNGTVTSTTSSATPTNTQPCNNYPEFCNRQYSNITEVAAHNAAFVRKNSAFANQEVPILGQLNDGIRMIQGEVHYVNGSTWNCHTDCNYLNTGPYEDTLRTIRQWVQANPYNVVTILIANSNYADVSVFEPAFENSGILDYIYLPSRRPMRLQDWPTLGEMILNNDRVVVFMDYMANETEVPYIINQYTNMWETPFSPVNVSFPCTVERPPGLREIDARTNLLYIANHNLNVQLDFAGLDILIPNFADLGDVNANNLTEGSLLNQALECDADWGRPPNFLIVDYYNVGDGSVFEVAARMNNVTYDRNCCGQATGLRAAAAALEIPKWIFVSSTLTLLAAVMTYIM